MTPGIPEPSRILISLCMIARDNAETIGAALQSAKPFVDEMIVVDTGSTDDTPEIALALGARVEYFPWCDDFSAARNYSISFAKGKWIFWMDTDDVLPEDCGNRLRATLAATVPETVFGFIMQVHCPSDGPIAGRIAPAVANPATEVREPESDRKSNIRSPDLANGISTIVDHVKILRRQPGLVFEGRIHEQVLPSIRRAGGSVVWTDIFVIHAGADYSPEGNRRKLQRDLRLLRIDVRERPQHPFVRFNLGMTLLHSGDFVEAREQLERCIEMSVTEESHLRKAYVLLADTLENLQLRSEAMRRCWEGLGRYPSDPELSFKLGRLSMLEERWDQAIEAFGRINQAVAAERYFSSIDPTIRGYKLFANLAVCYAQVGERRFSIDAWRKCLLDNPLFVDGWDGILEQCRILNDFELLETIVKELATQNGTTSFVSVAEALILAKSGSYSEAVEKFDREISTAENESFVLDSFARFLNENQDWEKSIPVLMRLRDLEPTNPSVHLNLGISYFQTNRLQDAMASLEESLQLRPWHAQANEVLNLIRLKLSEGYTSTEIPTINERH